MLIWSKNLWFSACYYNIFGSNLDWSHSSPSPFCSSSCSIFQFDVLGCWMNSYFWLLLGMGAFVLCEPPLSWSNELGRALNVWTPHFSFDLDFVVSYFSSLIWFSFLMDFSLFLVSYFLLLLPSFFLGCVTLLWVFNWMLWLDGFWVCSFIFYSNLAFLV